MQQYPRYRQTIIRTSEESVVDKAMIDEVYLNYSHGLYSESMVLDLGAHCGGYTVMCGLAGVRFYKGYEPLPSNFEILKLNADRFFGIEIEQAAVSNLYTDTVTFHVGTKINHTCSSSFNQLLEEDTIPIEVPNIHFLSAINECAWTHVKIDIEGGEIPILASDEFFLPDSVKHFFIEVHDDDYIRSSEFHEAHLKILNMGFKLERHGLKGYRDGHETLSKSTCFLGEFVEMALKCVDLYYTREV